MLQIGCGSPVGAIKWMRQDQRQTNNSFTWQALNQSATHMHHAYKDHVQTSILIQLRYNIVSTHTMVKHYISSPLSQHIVKNPNGLGHDALVVDSVKPPWGYRDDSPSDSWLLIGSDTSTVGGPVVSSSTFGLGLKDGGKVADKEYCAETPIISLLVVL